MHITQINICNYRNHKNTIIDFNDGINIIIGPNNSGKTNLIQAIRLVVDQTKSKRLSVDDFNKGTSLEEIKKAPPTITISIKINQDSANNKTDDQLATIYSWITNLTHPYEAQLTYKFYLPEKYHESYKRKVTSITSVSKIFQAIEKYFIHLYVGKIYGGNASSLNQAEPDDLQRFDFQFLTAIRDVERDFFTGKHSELRKVLEFFIDYEIKSSSETKEAKEAKIHNLETDFSNISSTVIDALQKRIKPGKEKILNYAIETGATFNNSKPDFEGGITESELFSALRLIIRNQTGIEVPATHNGLGYNNLIYISMLLAKMQENTNINYLSSELKTFSMLAIEEPEAHLHPSMQYKFLKFLQLNKTKNGNQIFITTHSTHITSASKLNNLICLHHEAGNIATAYPGKTFDINTESSRAYTERFLDATKADMLFSQKIIFVEGIAEQLLISVLAKYCGKSLEDHHISIINVGGRYFEHFLHMFDSNKPNTLHKKIACLTDRDPEYATIGSPDRYQKCYPFEYEKNNLTHYYKNNSEATTEKYKLHPNIRFFTQPAPHGKTLEYEIAYFNPGNNSIITDSISNRSELEKLISLYNTNKSTIDEFYSELRNSPENERIIESLKSSNLSDEEKKKSIISARYLNSVGKGENALELSETLSTLLEAKGPQSFIVPTYIKEAIEWICQ